MGRRMLVGAVAAASLGLARGASGESSAGTFEVARKARFTVEAPLVRVETDRYAIDVLGMCVSQVVDKRTGRAYCRPEGAKPGRRASLFLKDCRPGRPARTFHHVPDEPDPQRIRVRRLPRGVEYAVTGLVCPGDERTRAYHPEAMLGLRVEYDEATGDVVLTSLARAGRPEQFGVRDEGIFGTGLSIGPFADGAIRFIHPLGMPQPVESVKMGDPHGTWGAMWPVDYPVGLLVFQAPGGECLGVWADDPKLDFGKRFRSSDCVFSVDTLAGDAPWRTGELEAPIWRLNVFDSWEPAATRYREVMERTLGVQPLERREPAWARKIRLVTHQVWGVENFRRQYVARGVPVEAMIEWDTQGWVAGYATELLSPKRGEWWPNYPFEHATRYEGHPGYAESVKARQDFGVACFPYTCMFVGMSEPFGKESRALRAPDMGFEGGGRMWWVLYADMMEDLVGRYGVRGIYDDCSWIGPKYDPRGKVDGLTVWQAHVQGRRHMRDRLLPVAFMGERQHEVTIVSDFLALMWIGGEVHPINSYLFSPYALRWNQAAEVQQGNWLARGLNDAFELNNSLDADESLSCIPMVSTGKFLESPMRQETALIRKRMFFWAQEMLTQYFPKRYEPGVVAYLRGKDGTEYRTLSRGGMGLVRVKGRAEEVVWWRTKGVSELVCPGAAVEGWVAYDGDRIIGMNPGVRYVALEENARPPVTISRLPEGAYLAESRVEDGYWVARLGGKDAPAAAELVVSSGGSKIAFVGAEVLGEDRRAKTCRIRVPRDGAFAACWDRAPEAVAALPARLGAPSSRLEFVGAFGLPVLSQEAPGGPAGGERVKLHWNPAPEGGWIFRHSLQADYLVALPRAAAALETAANSSEAGVARVRIDGRIVAEAKLAGGGAPAPLRASLAGFAGRTVLVTFEGLVDGIKGQLTMEAPLLVAAR